MATPISGVFILLLVYHPENRGLYPTSFLMHYCDTASCPWEKILVTFYSTRCQVLVTIRTCMTLQKISISSEQCLLFVRMLLILANKLHRAVDFGAKLLLSTEGVSCEWAWSKQARLRLSTWIGPGSMIFHPFLRMYSFELVFSQFSSCRKI